MSATADADVAVVGLGVLGAAAMRAIALDGARVVGLERFAPGHANGSSHGRSRAVRFLYHAPEYVRLLPAAIDGWRALEAESGRRIYWPCGTLFFARHGNATFDQNVAIMAAGGVPFETLDADAARARIPAFAMPPGARGVWNRDGGFVDADAALRAFVSGARAAGGGIRTGSRVIALDLDRDPARVHCEDGSSVTARHVVIAAGAWTTGLLPSLRLPVRVTRQTWYTMAPCDPAAVAPGRVPVWCDYDTMYYGFPDHGPGLKIADDTPGREAGAESLVEGPVPAADSPATEERRALTAYLRERFPSAGLDPSEAEAGSCLYTLTPDEDFLLGPVPGSGGRASLVVGLNHAFKFAPVIGRILADLALEGATRHDIGRFRVDRFASAATDHEAPGERLR